MSLPTIPEQCECGTLFQKVTLLPLVCKCGKRYEADRWKCPPQLYFNSSVCRTSDCEWYNEDDTCQKTINIGLSQGLKRKGLVRWLDSHPEATCPRNPPRFLGEPTPMLYLRTCVKCGCCITDTRPREFCDNCVPNNPPPKRPSLPEIKVRNLIYHVYPKGDWKVNVNRILIACNQNVFNGTRTIAVATGPGLEDPTEYLRQLGADIIHIPNCPKIRETETFPHLLKTLQPNQNEATFYGHTKGNSTADNVEGARLWRSVMYDQLIDNWEDCMDALENYYFVGTHLYLWPNKCLSPFPTRLKPKYRWMMCGTFWWFRNDVILTHPRRTIIPKDRYAVEAWPAQMVNYCDSKSMWQPWEITEAAWPQLSPYEPKLYHQMGYFG